MRRGPTAGGAGGGEAFPSLRECLAAVFGGARAAWSPRVFGPAWLAASAAWGLWELALPALGQGRGAAGAALNGVAAALTALLFFPVLALASIQSAWEFGRGERLQLSEGLRILRARWRGIFLAPLFVPAGTALLLSVLVLGAAVLGLVPVIGKGLALGWLALPGLPLALLAGGLLLLGLPAFPLILAAGAIELPFPFDAAARGISYVRAGPCRYLALLASSLAGAAAAAAAFALLVLLVLGALAFAARVAIPPPPGASGGELLSEMLPGMARIAAGLDLLWPFVPAAAAGEGPQATGTRAALLVLAGRAVTGFAIAAAAAGWARTYLILRWKLDGEPPGALVRPGEEFRWSD